MSDDPSRLEVCIARELECVVIELSAPILWLTLSPDRARDLGRALIAKADDLCPETAIVMTFSVAGSNSRG